MSASNIAIGLLVLALMGSLYAINNYRKEVQNLNTRLTIMFSDMEILRFQRNSAEKALSERLEAQKEIDNDAARKNQLIDSLPSGWGNTPLPDECVRVFHYDPAASVGSSSSADGSHAAD